MSSKTGLVAQQVERRVVGPRDGGSTPLKPTPKPAPAPDPAPAPAAARVPLGESIGKTVKCPECGKPAEVSEARGGGLSARPVSSIFWVRLRCKGPCGTRLFKRDIPAEVLEPRTEAPRQMMLAEAVGQWVTCPGCGERARAAWTDKLAHCIDCNLCQCRPYSPETVVEVFPR